MSNLHAALYHGKARLSTVSTDFVESCPWEYPKRRETAKNEGGNMRNICKKAASLLLVTMILLSMVVTGAVAEAAAPTAVKSCEKSGLYTTVLNFEFSDTTWLDAVNGVTVNGTAYTNQTINSFSSDTGIWCVGNATGTYGSYKALQLSVTNDASFPLTVEVTASGYNKLTMEVAKTTVSYNDVYTATVKTPEVEPSTPPTEPTEEPTPVEDTDPPTSFTASSNFGSDFNLTFSGAYDWLNSITAVQVNGTAWEKASSSFGVSRNSNYYVRPGNEYEDGYLYIGEGFDTNPATCIITAKGYKPLTLTLDKSNHKVTIGAVEETTYKAYAAKAENGSISLSASEGIKKGETVTVTVTPDVDYELDTLTVKTESKEVETKKVSETSYTFAMPAANVTVTAKFKASALKVVDIDKVTLTEDTFGNDWHINFSEPSDYVENVTGFKVNGISWEERSYNISSGGAYRKYADDNYIQIAQKSYSASENEVPVRSGDVITISAKGYEDLNLKFVIDTSGKASLVADDGEGDPYELHVKIEGSFEAAIVGQKDYDGVSGASTGGSTSNSNSNVTVYGALVEKDKEPTDDD